MAKTTLDLLRERQSESVLRNLSESSPLPKLTNTDSEFTKGLASAALGVEAGLRGFAANIAENFAPEWAKSQLGEINKLTKQAAAVGPRVTDLRDIHGVGDAVDFAMGGLGQAVPSIGTALAGGGLANLGLKAAGFTVRPLAANIIGGTAGLLPQEAGEAAVTMYQDPVAMANTTPAERTALMLGKGTVNAALESLVPSMMGEKVLGNSLTQFIKPGIKPALAHAGKEALKNAAYEGATEGAQQVTGNIAHHIANPNEDLLGGWDVINAAAMGALPGAVMGAGGAGGDIFRSNIGMQKTDDGEIAPSTFKTAQKAGEETGKEVGYATGWLGKKLAAMLAGKGETTRKNMQELAPEEELVINSQDKSVGLGEAITYNLRNEWGVPTNEELEEAKHILSYVLSRTISDKGIDRAEGVLQHYFGDRAERFLDMVHNYRLMPEMYGPQSQLSGMGSVGAEDIHGDMSDEDSADFGSDTATYDELSDDGSEKRHEWNDRLQVVDEDKDPERISFSDLDKWATPKAVPWTEEEMEEAKVSDRTKAFQMALQNRRMQRSKDGKLVPDDGIYLKRDTNLVDTETGEVRKPEVFRTSARTLVEQAREMGQNNDADIDEISNHESVVRDFLRGLSTLIDSGQFTSVGGMKAGKRVGPAQDMKFVALYSRPDKKTLYDTKEAAQQAIDDKKEPGSVKKDGATGRYYVNWSNSQEVLDPITKSYDAMLRVIKSLPQDMEIMPGVTMASAQAALKERLISTGYKTPKSAKDFPESNNPARSARMSNRRSMEYKTRTRLDELSVEGLSQEYAAASSDTPFDIARRDDIMDEVVDRLRKAGLDENEAYEVISGERVKDVPQIEPEVLGRAKSNAATFTTTGATQYTLIAGPRNEKGGLLSKSSAMQFAKEGDVVRKLQSGGWGVERPVGPSVSSNPRYSKGVATKTKSSGSSENGKNITRVDKWGAVSLPQEQELFRKPKKHDAENIDEDRRTAGDLESDLLGVRNFNENIEGRQEPIHGERPTPRNPFSNAASALDELAKRLAGAIESGAHPKHMEHLIKQIGAIKQRNKLAEARKTVVAKLEYGAHTNRKNAPENQGATPAELEAMEKGAEARKAEVARLEELHEQLINASMMLAGKVDAPYTEGLSRQILIALKTGAQLPTRVDKAVQRLSDRAMAAAVEKKLVIGKSDTAIDVAKDETSAAMFKAAPSDQLQRIAAFLEQVKADPAAHKSRASQILARAKAFDSAYHGWDITRAFKDALGVGNVKKPAAPVKSSSDTTMTMAFTDGTIYGGSAHNMRPEFAGKSTMDLIKDGKRTATTRRQRPNVNVGDIITMDDTRGTKIQVVVTKAPYQLKWGVDQDKNKANAEKWSELEGWDPEVFEAYAKSGSWQFQYELAEETKKTGTYDNPIIGDIWAQDGFKIVSTNLGGVHGRGLAKQAKDKRLISASNKDFESSPLNNKVITLAVKGNAPETAKIRGQAFSEQVVGKNVDLLKSELRKLIQYARAHKDQKFFLPYIGLGFGEGNVEEIRPFLEFAAKEPNIFMVAKDQATVDSYADSFKPGVRRDATTRRGEETRETADSKTPEFDKLPAYKEGQRAMTYAGIGSRETPKEVMALMTKYAKRLAQLGYTLRSGGATGADSAFEAGADKKEIFYAKDATDQTRAIAKEIHPAPSALKPVPLNLMARNTNQLFGKNLDTPVDFVLVWTPDGAESTAERNIKTGGTGQAIDMASRKGIPVFNLAKTDGRARFESFMKSGNNVVTRQNAQRDIRTAFAAIDDAKNAKTSQEGRDALTEAHHLISIANVSEAQEWVARRKLKAAEDKVRKLQAMEGAAEHEQNIKYSEQRSSEEPDIPGTFASLHEDPETKDAIEKWLKEVAPQATVEFVEALKGGGSGSWSLSPATGERLVKVSVYSQHPWSIAYHEALHDLFQTLRESGHDEAIRIMQDVASMPNIKKRLAMLLDGHPEAIKQLDDPEEAAAYLFQFWALGYQGLDKLNTMIKGLGPKTENFFTKLWRAIRDTFGWLSDQEKAELIMANFYEAKLADPIAMKAVMDKVENSSTAFSSAIAPIKQLGDKVFATADARLRESGFKSFVTLTDLFQPDLTGKSKAKMMDNTEDNIGLFNAVYQMENKGIAELADSILDGVTPDELNKALEHLQVGRDVRDIENPVEQAIVNKTRKLLGKYITYLRDAGVTSWDEESRSFKLIGDLGKNYFPRKWDFDMLIQHGDEFISDLVAKHADVLQKLVDKEIEARRKTDPNADVSKITIENAARTIHAHLTNQGGMETMMPHDIREGEDIGTLTETKEKLGFTPFMVAANERSLKFIDMEHFHKYLEKDYVKTMTTYIAQAVKRAEYSRRFGPQGQRIAQAMQKSEEQAVKALYRDEWENFDKRVAQIEDQLKAESTVRRLTSQPIHSKDEIEARREELYVQEFENWTARSKELQKKGADKVAEFSDTIRALEGTLGRDISPQLRNFNSWMMTYQSWRLLPLSLFSSVTDPLGIMIRGGSAKQAYNAFVRGVKEVYRTYKNQPSTSSDDPAVKLAKDFGMLEAVGALDALGQSYSSVYMSSGPKKASDLLFKINGMEAWNRAMRIQGTVAAVEWLKEAIGTTDPNVARQLKELGLTQDDLKLKKDGTLDLSNPDKKIQRAVATWVNTAILRPNAAQRPVWASNPKMSLFFHLMQYTYSMQKVILGRVWHEAKHGNWTPLTTMAVAYTPVAIAGMAVKGVIQGGGDEPEWMKGMGPVDWLIAGVNRAGLLGIPGSILETNESSDLAKGDNGTIGDKMVGTMLPMPAVDQLMDIVSPGSNDNLKTDFVKALPLSTVFRGWAPVHDWTKS